MIRCKMSVDKNIQKVKANGKLNDLIAEAMAIIEIVYEGLYEKSPQAADEFKRLMQAGMLDPRSPVFKKRYGR